MNARLKAGRLGRTSSPVVWNEGLNRSHRETPATRGPTRQHRSKLTIDEERTVKLAARPPGSRFKGYTSFVVQIWRSMCMW
jgi:hypothetical protein